MSGGHYDYDYFKVQMLADAIEHDFLNDGKFMQEDWSADTDFRTGKKPMVEADYLADATEEERPLILAEIRSLIADLKRDAFRAKELEWLLSGDTGCTSYLKRLDEYGLGR